ncbi:MAG: RNase adapter RapZ [Oscillospiraceae bacterium]|nr:RNase adapter RapZ [Oscillospiraceae bacterium]MBR2504235.1 RNase adapter RapZ [Oscillospiraceae bacterium]
MDKGLLIITGLSGAGKSLALSALEDVGFFCIDNMPAPLVVKFLEMKDDFMVNNQKIACVIDIRNGENNTELFNLVAKLQKENVAKVIFLDANEKVILDRYKETRRKHPVMLRKNLSLEEAVKYEKEALNQLYSQADCILDTSLLSTAQLKDRILSFAVHDVKETITIDVISFGFKFGVPADVDVMFDVRCFLNPFYVKGLREKTGNDEEIVDFVFSQPEAKVLLEKYIDVIDYSLPLYIKEGKSHLTIGFGCTGGKHRSVAFCNALYEHIAEKGYKVMVHHRDINRRK